MSDTPWTTAKHRSGLVTPIMTSCARSRGLIQMEPPPVNRLRLGGADADAEHGQPVFVGEEHAGQLAEPLGDAVAAVRPHRRGAGEPPVARVHADHVVAAGVDDTLHAGGACRPKRMMHPGGVAGDLIRPGRVGRASRQVQHGLARQVARDHFVSRRVGGRMPVEQLQRQAGAAHVRAPRRPAGRCRRGPDPPCGTACGVRSGPTRVMGPAASPRAGCIGTAPGATTRPPRASAVSRACGIIIAACLVRPPGRPPWRRAFTACPGCRQVDCRGGSSGRVRGRGRRGEAPHDIVFSIPCPLTPGPHRVAAERHELRCSSPTIQFTTSAPPRAPSPARTATGRPRP